MQLLKKVIFMYIAKSQLLVSTLNKQTLEQLNHYETDRAKA